MFVLSLRPSPLPAARSASQTAKNPSLPCAPSKAPTTADSIWLSRSPAPDFSMRTKLIALAQHSRPPRTQVLVSIGIVRYASIAESANFTSLGFRLSQTRSHNRALIQGSSTSSMTSAKKVRSESSKSSGITERLPSITMNGLKGSFRLCGESIIEQASARSHSTLPWACRPSSIALRAAFEKSCQMEEYPSCGAPAITSRQPLALKSAADICKSAG